MNKPATLLPERFVMDRNDMSPLEAYDHMTPEQQKEHLTEDRGYCIMVRASDFDAAAQDTRRLDFMIQSAPLFFEQNQTELGKLYRLSTRNDDEDLVPLSTWKRSVREAIDAAIPTEIQGQKGL